MSRLTKFLKQTCSHESAQRTSNGKTKLSTYGDVLYHRPRTLKCRREKIVTDIQTSSGAILKTSSRYFLDDKVEIFADDRLDGHVVLDVREYTNQLGKCEGYECYV